MYSPLVAQLFRQPRAAGSFANHDSDVVRGEAGSIRAGAWVRLSLRIRDGRVTDARFQAYGCPHTLAAAEWLARHLAGQPLEEAFPGGAQELARVLEVPTEKLGRLLIVEDALRGCVRQWQGRRVESATGCGA